MKRILFMAAMLVVAIGSFAVEPTPANRYRVLGTKRLKTLQSELDQAVAGGYALIGGETNVKFVVLERADGAAKKYRVDDRLLNTVKKGDYKGYRIIPWSFSNYDGVGAIFEALPADEPQPEYKISSTAYTRNLQKDLTEASAGGFRAIALSGSEYGQAVLMQKSSTATGAAVYELHATKKISTMEKEISEAASRGFAVIGATGAGHEILVVMEKQEADAPKRDYRVISTSRTSTFEKEINASAAEGYRIVPGTGAALQKGGMLTIGTYAFEQAIIMQKGDASKPVRYMLLGAQREGTIERELNATPAECKVATIFVTYQEAVTLLECPAK